MSSVSLLPKETIEKLISEGKIDRAFIEKEMRAAAERQCRVNHKISVHHIKVGAAAFLAAAAVVGGITAVILLDTTKATTTPKPQKSTSSIYNERSMKGQTPYWNQSIATPR